MKHTLIGSILFFVGTTIYLKLCAISQKKNPRSGYAKIVKKGDKTGPPIQ